MEDPYYAIAVKKHENICTQLKEIISEYTELIKLIELSNIPQKKKDIQAMEYLNQMYGGFLWDADLYVQTLKTFLSQQQCDHHFITDLRDITPDHSDTIEYCTHCLATK